MTLQDSICLREIDVKRVGAGTLKAAGTWLFALCLFVPVSTSWAAERFDPATECTSRDRGPYPWNFRQIVESYISETFFDPGSVAGLEIHKPAPGWWSTAALKMTRRNTQCYWYIAFSANGKNRMGGYVGRKVYGLWVRNGGIRVSQERTGIDQEVITSGERAFAAELEKLDEQGRQAALQLSRKERDQSSISESPSYLQELRSLAALRDEGVITEEEFQTKKSQILGLSETKSEPAQPPE
ncbi:MAG: SHOCT domain-containing protein [Rhodocyclaceae bacterium]|jgi:hypothetical protein|nr:SHOCT domain-containing protein [Rhodocyclaceae bacterium]